MKMLFSINVIISAGLAVSGGAAALPPAPSNGPTPKHEARQLGPLIDIVNQLGGLLPRFPPLLGTILPGLELPAGTELSDVELPNLNLPLPQPSAPQIATYPQPGQRLGLGLLPVPLVNNVTYATEPMTFLDRNGKPYNVLRDLGFSSVFSGRILYTFGDTLVGVPGRNFLTAVDSVAVGYTQNRNVASDFDMSGAAVNSFIPLNDAERRDGGYSRFAFGGTQIIEYAPQKGAVWYLKIKRQAGDLLGTTTVMYGAGVADVRLDNGVARATRHGDTLWSSSEPAWGDVGVVLDSTEGYIYVYGHGPKGESSTATFMARVPQGSPADIDSYEYWVADELRWTKQRLGDGLHGSLKLRPSMALFGPGIMNQAAPFWSNHYNMWLWIYGTQSGFSNIHLMSAPSLAGPWIPHGFIVGKTLTGQESKQPGGSALVYAINAHPEYDDSGRTIWVTWTDNNRIWGATIEFV